MEANLAGAIAAREGFTDYNSAVIGDLGPTPDFVMAGLTDAEDGRGMATASEYYLHLNSADIDANIIGHTEVLKKIYEIRNGRMEEIEEAHPDMTDAQKKLMKEQIVNQILIDTFYKDKNVLMGEKQRGAIVNQSLITDIANSATTPALQKFKPEVMKDLFPDGMMPYTTKRTMELRTLGHSPENIKKQIQAEEIFYNMMGIKVADDSNIPHFNDVIMSSFVQAMADEKGYDTDIDTLLALDATYAYNDANKPTRKRSAQIMRRVKDPKTTYMWLMMEEMENNARENWWRRFL